MRVSSSAKLRIEGQSLWLNNFSRESIHDGSLLRYVHDYSISGLSLSTESLKKAAAESTAYDSAIDKRLSDGIYGEPLVCSLVLDDVRHAADLLRPIHDRTDGVDGWAILPASPLAADNPDTLPAVILKLKKKILRPNALIRLPLIPERIGGIEELVYEGTAIKITNIYTPAQFAEVAGRCLRGIERRIEKKLKPVVPIYISIDILRLEKELRNLLPEKKAMEAAYTAAKRIYASMRKLHNSQRWEAAYNSGARPLRLVWNCASGSSENETSLGMAIKLKAPRTVLSLPQGLVQPFLKSMGKSVIPDEPGDGDRELDRYLDRKGGLELIAEKLQGKVVKNLRESWIMMSEIVAKKCARVTQQQKLI